MPSLIDSMETVEVKVQGKTLEVGAKVLTLNPEYELAAADDIDEKTKKDMMELDKQTSQSTKGMTKGERTKLKETKR